MKKFKIISIVLVSIAIFGFSNSLYAGPFNGVADNEVDALGYYYIITGGKFPTGPIPNGDNASGGTFRYLLDDPGWGGGIRSMVGRRMIGSQIMPVSPLPSKMVNL